MPIINRQDTQEVEHYVGWFFAAPSAGRAQALRRLFMEKLDFASATGAVSLANAPKNVALPPQAERIASMEALHVVYVPLNGNGPDRVRKAEAAAAAKLIADALHGDLLLVMTNPSSSQLHVIYPTFLGATPSLRRMIIERDLPRRTAVQQLSNIFWQWKDTGSIRMAVDRAFDVEAVTREFFREYKRIFDSVMDMVIGFGKGEDEQEAKKLFVQTLFNRLMFIHFLSRKGWLKFKDAPDYLNALRKDYPAWPGEKNFYDIRLKLLFFAGLNNDTSRDVRNPVLASLIGDVPFLNGGLFEETADDKRSNVAVPDEAIDLILRQLFDRFNFTVMESTPFDVEVAVDPEMLGKVFEELVTGRHESGSYYTPRPVVSFMCREGLKGYLEAQNTGASAEAIAAFVDHKDTSQLTLSSAPKVGEALARVKVVDPACGSGAYLLGMMQELVELMTALYSTQLSHQAQDLYNLKLRIIEQNLYGADIDQFAVNIAMLRLWLSLAIDYDGPVPPPLPNLDFKIVCGDSLLGPDPNPTSQSTLFRHRVHQLAGQLADLKDKHMRATGQEKTNLTKDIERLKGQLREALADSAAPDGVVDWRVEFAEVFDTSGGFDIVVANPPYVRQELIKHLKPAMMAIYPWVYAGTADLYCYFYARAEQLLCGGGMLAFISPNKWFRANYGTKLRKYIAETCRIHSITDFGELPVFEGSATFPMIFMAQKGIERTAQSVFTQVKSLEPPYPDVAAIIREQGQVLPAGSLNGADWRLTNAATIASMSKMETAGVPLEEYVNGRIYVGIKTGFNHAFWIDGKTRAQLVAEEPQSVEIIKPLIVGDDVRRWRIDQDRWLIATEIGVNIRRYPAVLAHLKQWQSELKKRRDQGKYWWELRACAYYDAFRAPKIVFPDIGKEPRFGFDTTGAYVDMTAFVIPVEDFYLLGVLNSSTVWEYLCSTAAVLGDANRGGRVRLKRIYVRRLPIPKAASADRTAIALLAERCLQTKGNGVEQWEQEIDERVAWLYGLDRKLPNGPGQLRRGH